MSFECVKARYDTKRTREGIPATWSIIGESFFAKGRRRVKLGGVKEHVKRRLQFDFDSER